MKTAVPALAANIIIIILELIGTSISISSEGIKNLRWYTVLSNVFALAASCCYVTAVLICGMNKLPQWVRLTRFGATVCLSVTFLIVVFVLVPMSVPGGTAAEVLYKGPQIYHHILCPLTSVGSFVFLEAAPEGGLRLALYAAIPTLLYAVVLTVLNIAKVTHGPYPFLFVYEQPWYASALWFIAIVSLSAGVAAGLMKLRTIF